jgi:chromosome segregation ATPase
LPPKSSGQQVEKLRINLKKAIAAAKDARAQKRALADELKIISQSKVPLEKRIKELVKMNSDTERSNVVIAKERDALREENGRSNERILELEATIKQLQQSAIRNEGIEASQTQTEPNEIQTKTQNQAEGVPEVGPETPDPGTSDATAPVTALNETIDALNAKVSEYETGQAEHNATMTSVQETLTKRESQLEQAAVQMAELTTKVETLEDACERYQGELADAQAQLARTTKALEDANAQNLDARQLQADLEEEVEKRSALMEEGMALSKKQATMETQIRELQSAAHTSKNAANEAKEEKDAMELQYKAMQKRLQGNNLKMAESESASYNVQQSQKSMEKKIKSCEGNIKKLTAEREELKGAVSDALQNLAREAEKVAVLKQDIARLEAEKDKVELNSKESGSAAKESREREDKLSAQVETLQKAATDMVSLGNDREKQFQAKVQLMRTKAELAEQRNEELMQEATNATKPLLRQIRSLQKLHDDRALSWDSAEALLTERLATTEAQLSRAKEAKRAVEKDKARATQKLLLVEEELAQSNADLEQERAARAALEEEAKETNQRLTKVQEGLASHAQTVEGLETTVHRLTVEASSATGTLHAVEMERDSLAEQLRRAEGALKEQVERRNELAQIHAAAASIAESVVDSEGGRTSAAGSFSGEPRLSDSSSLLSSVLLGGGGSEDATDEPDADLAFIAKNSGNSLRVPVSRLERTMAHLRRQIRQLRGSIRSLESDRRDMAEKVLELESAKQALHDAQKNATAEKQKLQAVTQKQNVLLELLGEKEEAIECLEDNIATMKTMYRQQTTDLLTRIETLEGGGR